MVFGHLFWEGNGELGVWAGELRRGLERSVRSPLDGGGEAPSVSGSVREKNGKRQKFEIGIMRKDFGDGGSEGVD